ncbi:hypothetical protein [Rubinisphaera margarita]|uniref:hypothetical protein n=1 Tax=Rubinisphaera margarita TaxID=2909586 RepID=UPI001EE9677D|nr:hypothetical protein [Rubinisphaera margarita]MCG6158097.1 hypothetical protein [Rubinisphaera margarita]
MAFYLGTMPDSVRVGFNEPRSIGEYTVYPYYVQTENGEVLSHYVASLEVRLMNENGLFEDVQRFDWIIPAGELGGFIKNVDRYESAAGVSFGLNRNLEEWQIKLHAGEPISDWGGDYVYDKWTDPWNYFAAFQEIVGAAGPVRPHGPKPKTPFPHSANPKAPAKTTPPLKQVGGDAEIDLSDQSKGKSGDTLEGKEGSAERGFDDSINKGRREPDEPPRPNGISLVDDPESLPNGGPTSEGTYVFYHGTDAASASDLCSNGIQPKGLNDGGFYGTVSPKRAADYGAILRSRSQKRCSEICSTRGIFNEIQYSSMPFL